MVGFALMAMYYLIGYDSGAKLTAQIATKTAEVKDYNQKIAEENKRIEQIEQFKKAAAVMGDNFQTFLTYIPSKLNVFELMKTISSEAKSANLQIRRLQPGGFAAEKSATFYEQIGIDADLVGTFQQLMLFLSVLTKVDRILTVKSISLVPEMSSRTKDNDSPNLHMGIEVIGYRFISEVKK
jgi:Tfp pilus assembly protein PilO